MGFMHILFTSLNPVLHSVQLLEALVHDWQAIWQGSHCYEIGEKKEPIEQLVEDGTHCN